MQTYRVAQRLLSIDPPLPEMAPRRVDDVSPPSAVAGRGDGRRIGCQPVFRGEGQLGSGQRHIECRWSDRGYSLQVDGVGHFRISDDGRQITRSDSGSEPDPATPTSHQPLTETVLGPAMTLALALQGVWCLHASAVESRGEVVAFLGLSGAGKSTLGRELPRLDSHVRCAADDVLPVALDHDAVHVLPRFPQLKYRLDQQPGDALPVSLPLRRIYVLEPISDPSAELSAEPLSGTAAVLALVRHTVASRLFTQELLKRHMDACVQIAEFVEISGLCYPHRPASLDQARELLFPRTS